MADEVNKKKHEEVQPKQDENTNEPRNQESATAIKPASTEIKPATGSAKNSK